MRWRPRHSSSGSPPVRELTAIAAVSARRSGPRSSTTGCTAPSDIIPAQLPARRRENMTTERQPARVSALTDQHRDQIPRPPRIAARRTAGNAMGPRWLWGLIVPVLLVTCGIAGCSQSGPAAAPATSAAAPATPKAPKAPKAPDATPKAPTAPAAPPKAPEPQKAPAGPPTAPKAPASSPKAAPSGKSLPEYKPSTVISNGNGTTVLRSPHSVGKVAAFYEGALKSGGWQWHATARSRYSAHFEATKGSARAVIQISSAGQGVSISVTVTG